MTLTEFLLARVAEDEAIARAASDCIPPASGGYIEIRLPATEYLTVDPDRVMAECAAKRRLLDLHESVPYYGLDRYGRWLPHEGEPKRWYCECQCEDGMIGGEEPCETKRIVALLYADHPDYRDEWRMS